MSRSSLQSALKIIRKAKLKLWYYWIKRIFVQNFWLEIHSHIQLISKYTGLFSFLKNYSFGKWYRNKQWGLFYILAVEVDPIFLNRGFYHFSLGSLILLGEFWNKNTNHFDVNWLTCILYKMGALITSGS